MCWPLVATSEEEGFVSVVDQPVVGQRSDVVVLTWTPVEEAALLAPDPKELLVDVEPYPVADDVLLQ